MQVAAADPLMPFTGLIATAVHANEDRPWTAGSYDTPMAGFFQKNCTDRVSFVQTCSPKLMLYTPDFFFVRDEI